jgi:2-dehydropantoate 2-reductase
MHILIVGTGALATLFAARLGAAGHVVSLLGTWQLGLRALGTSGARLLEAAGAQLTQVVKATDDPQDSVGARHAIVLVKAWQTERVARQLAVCLADDGVALTLQNGLGNRETLIQHLGPDRVAFGVTTTGATLLGPGLARAGGDGTIALEHHPGVEPLADAFRSAGMRVEQVADAAGLAWSKLVANAAINPLSAILQVTNGELLQRLDARDLMAELASEAARVARACGVQLPFEDAIAHAEAVALQTASNHSSMFQDVRRGAPTEIDAICGAIVDLGRAKQVPTPANRFCWKLVRALVADRRDAAIVSSIGASYFGGTSG